MRSQGVDLENNLQTFIHGRRGCGIN